MARRKKTTVLNLMAIEGYKTGSRIMGNGDNWVEIKRKLCIPERITNDLPKLPCFIIFVAVMSQQ
jgi:hypothetical protein